MATVSNNATPLSPEEVTRELVLRYYRGLLTEHRRAVLRLEEYKRNSVSQKIQEMVESEITKASVSSGAEEGISFNVPPPPPALVEQVNQLNYKLVGQRETLLNTLNHLEDKIRSYKLEESVIVDN